MSIPIYWVDAFETGPFTGNPAAVCVLPRWLDDGLLQSIANQNNLSETAFIVADGKHWQIRWFTPVAEVDLCGHATLASAAVISRFLRPDADMIEFSSRSGTLRVRREAEHLVLVFPSRPAQVRERLEPLAAALGAMPIAGWRAHYLLAEFADQDQILGLKPDFSRVAALGNTGVIATAPGRAPIDFVSRFFAPAVGVNEDPVTGSAHCALVPYWSERLDRTELRAKQLSTRGGELRCRFLGDTVEIGGRVRHYLQGTIEI
ncbi:MAG: PhzF family phenazine biosynthesis protein [Gammaproteobacteria bacterium]